MNKPAKAGSHIYIGTSGWHFDSWDNDFYPPDTSHDERLAYYSGIFDSVELNNSFYQLPEADAIQAWLDSTPNRFRFSVKASRYLTHMKKLREAEDGLDNFLSAIEAFGKRLGPILFQLPPNWHVNIDRLSDFLSVLPGKYRYAFEFRDKTWLCQDVYSLLRDYNAALCFYDFEGFRSPEVTTADFIYIRLHGPGKTPYEGSYDGRTLAGLAKKFLRWRDEGKRIYCYFDNDKKACAPHDARRLRESLLRQGDSGR